MKLQQYTCAACSISTILLLSSCTGDQSNQQPNSAIADGDEENPPPVLVSTPQALALTPPVEIVQSGTYGDGGTTFVHLKDAAKQELMLCVSENGFEYLVPGDTLFLDATNAWVAGARLPESKEEATKVVLTLESALTSTLPDEQRKKYQNQGEPLEHFWRERSNKSEVEQWGEKEWITENAFGAYQRLKSKSDFSILNKADSVIPEWYSKYDAYRREQLAEEQRTKDADTLFKSFYPEQARDLLTLAAKEGWAQVEPEGANANSEDEDVVQQGRRLAEAVGDPIELAEISCRALGTLNEDWTHTILRDRIAVQAMLTVTPEQYLEALTKIAANEQAMLGAGRIFFYHRYGSKLEAAMWERWAPVLAKVLLEKGADDNKARVVRIITNAKHPGALPLLRKIARGEIGVEPVLPDPSDPWQKDEEPGLRETTYLVLAMREVESVRDEITQALPEASMKQNQVALEVALALLGDPTYLKKQSLGLDSHHICLAAIRAIERFEGKPGMDLLMSAGLDHHYAAIANEAILAAQRISGQQWIPEGSDHQPRNFSDEAKAWWQKNRDRF
ncbi:hypothetical protein [Adhaeretor mobilis]|uniref:Uncharacterized protein n=1 Tax=Adhaeretor mobilis TaxID=1930276 RepID=A0A517MPJ7_9BACT|nr:hypothetical protein [Adhaeretor mobilis]QDS96801.1 hypothetical protein HG15A2_00590 [Adhaeretor mobilis]